MPEILKATGEPIVTPTPETKPLGQGEPAKAVEPVTPVTPAVEPTPTPPVDDLLTRVSKFQTEKAPAVNPQPQNTGDENFDIREIEAITDPVAKEQAMKAYKSFQRGFGEKFQELSQLKKEMEALKAQPIVQPVPQEWTAERVQALANDPTFIEAARKVQESNQTDENSTMSEAERAKINELNQKITNLEKANTQVLTEQQKVLRTTQHESLGAKYANYVPQEIDTITFDMLNGKITTTPEHIYKAFKHDENVQKAYEMGRVDERQGVPEKIASSSPQAVIQTTPSSPTIVPKEGQSSKSFFDDIIVKNLNTVGRN